MNYLIVDDEPQARKLLQTYMSGMSNYQLVKLCATAMEAYEALHTSKIDLMFLDIKMPIVSGIDFLRSLKDPPLVVFTTAYNKYALNGYELNVVDYLLKPIALPRLLQALEKVQGRFGKSKNLIPQSNVSYIFLKTDGRLVKYNLANIILIEGMQNFVKIHLKDSISVVSYTMLALQEMLPADQFLRVHRSYIVPLAAINAINGNIIETHYRKIPIGNSYRSAVMSYINPK